MGQTGVFACSRGYPAMETYPHSDTGIRFDCDMPGIGESRAGPAHPLLSGPSPVCSYLFYALKKARVVSEARNPLLRTTPGGEAIGGCIHCGCTLSFQWLVYAWPYTMT